MKRTTWVALGVFAALLVAVAVLWRGAPERGITRLSFPGLHGAGIDHVVVTGKQPVELRRENESWKLVDGRAADPEAVKRLVDATAKLVSSDLVSEDAARHAEFEVDDEKGVQVTLSQGGQTAATLVVGKAAPGGATYVRVGQQVFRVAGFYRGLFAKEPTAWLDRKLFADAVTDVSRLEVRLNGVSPYVLVKNADAWSLEDPSVLPAGFRFDPKAATALVSAVVNARANDVLATTVDPKVSGLGESADVLRYSLGAVDGAEPATSHELRLGAKKDETVWYASTDRRSDVLLLASSTVTSLRKQPTDLRDLGIVALDANNVRALSIVEGARVLELVKKDDGWSIARSTEAVPKGFELDPQAVSRRVSTLGSARATRVAPDVSISTAGLGRPVAKVSATLVDGTVAQLAFGKDFEVDGRKEAYALGNIDREVYVVAPWTRSSLLGGLETLRKKANDDPMLNLDPKALSGLPPEVRANLEQQIAQKKRQQEMLKRLGSGGAPTQP